MARSVSRRKRDRSSSRSPSSSRSSSTSSSSSSPSSSSSSSSSVSTRSSSSSSSSSRSSRSAASRSNRINRKRSPPPTGACKVQVNRLSKNVNKGHILEIFKSYGPIKSVDLPTDRHHPHLGRGSAFIEFEKTEDADKAVRYMDGGQIDGQEITVSRRK